MELATVIVIIGILIAMVLPGFAYLRGRAERGKCVANLKNLYVGATLYIQEQGHWPQVDTALFQKPAFAEAWQRALEKYSISPINWVCPTVQRELGNPDLFNPASRRIDYYASPFGDERNLPYKWPRQPWFTERADMHGDGQMIIFANGNVKSLSEVLRDTQVQSLD